MDFIPLHCFEFSGAGIPGSSEIIEQIPSPNTWLPEKRGQSSNSIEMIRIFTNKGNFYIKYFSATKWSKTMKDFFRISPGKRSFIKAQELKEKGILCPNPIAYLEAGLSSIYIAEEIRGNTLGSFRNDILSSGGTFPSDFEKFVNGLARFIRLLHSKGIYHEDLTSKNIIYIRENKQYTFGLLDLDALKSKSLTERRKIRNLTRLNYDFLDLRVFTVKIRKKFLSWYEPNNAKRKELWHAIKRETMRMLKRNGRQFIF